MFRLWMARLDVTGRCEYPGKKVIVLSAEFDSLFDSSEDAYRSVSLIALNAALKLPLFHGTPSVLDTTVVAQFGSRARLVKREVLRYA